MSRFNESITVRQIEPDVIANVLTYLRFSTLDDELVDEVREAAEFGRALILDWVQEHLRGGELVPMGKRVPEVTL